MKHGTYIGNDPQFKGQAAIIQDNNDPDAENHSILVQFDDIKTLPMQYTHGWTPFYASEFKYDPPIDWEQS